MKKFFLLSSLFLIISAFAYTSEDLSSANYLADQKIVTKQTVASKYRLDDKILRQEVIAMALKIKGVTLPENYKCKKYFSDVTSSNDWVCRAIEVAADNGIITRGNKYANPGKYVTRAEALAMIISQYNLDPFPEVSPEGNAWQAEVARKYIGIGIQNRSSSDGFIIKEVKDGMGFTAQWSPNRLATRAEVFAFARNILNNSATQSYEGFEADFQGDYSRTNSEDLSEYGGEPFISYGFGNIGMLEGGETRVFSITVFPITSFTEGSAEYEKKYWNGHVYYAGFSPPGMCGETGKLIFITEQHMLVAQGVCMQTILDVENALRDIKFDVKDSRSFISLDVLRKYYTLLDVRSSQYAYQMRSPSGVSLATFQSWYNNTESVIFREDTLKSLGDNTYEFLVDMVEGGKKSTYKVKSKVNLEKFTIDNISSVKQ